VAKFVGKLLEFSGDRFFMSRGSWMQSSRGVLEASGKRNSGAVVSKTAETGQRSGLHQFGRVGQFNVLSQRLIPPACGIMPAMTSCGFDRRVTRSKGPQQIR